MNKIKTSKLIGEKLRNYRINEVNESQELFSARIHCAQTTLSKYEKQGISNIDDIEDIGKILGIDLLDDSKEFIVQKHILDKIYSFYINTQNRNLDESFLTKNHLKTKLLYGYNEEELENILFVLNSKSFITIIKNDEDPNDNTEFILMRSKGILLLDTDSIFPSELSGDIVSNERLTEEFKKYNNSKYLGNHEDFSKEAICEIFQESNSRKKWELKTLCNNVKKYRKKYIDLKHPENNTVLTKSISINSNRKAFINGNILILNNRNQKDMLEQNLMQSNMSHIVFDTNDQLLRDTGAALEKKGYVIKVLNLADPEHSLSYNPISYLKKFSDVTNLIDVLFKTTENQGLDTYYNQTEKNLLMALILYLQENQEIPIEYKNFTNVMKLLQAADINENDPNERSPLDKLLARHEALNPNSPAVRQYKIFKLCSFKVQKKSIINCMNLLAFFALPSLETLTSVDDLDLARIGDEKTALFVISPGGHSLYNFLISILYTQLISVLSFHARFECAYEYYIKNNQEVLAIIPPNKNGNKYTERDAKRLLKALKLTPIKYTEAKYYIKTKGFYTEFLSEEDAKSFKKNLEKVMLDKGTGQFPNNISLLINNIVDRDIFFDIDKHLTCMPEIGLNYIISVDGLLSLKHSFNNNWMKIINNCSSLIVSATDYDTFSYIEAQYDIPYDYFTCNPNKCLLTVKGLEPMIDDIYISGISTLEEYDYRQKFARNDSQNKMINDLEKGLEKYVVNRKPLDQVFKEANANTVRDVINRVVLKEGNVVVDESENHDTIQFSYTIE